MRMRNDQFGIPQHPFFKEYHIQIKCPWGIGKAANPAETFFDPPQEPQKSPWLHRRRDVDRRIDKIILL